MRPRRNVLGPLIDIVIINKLQINSRSRGNNHLTATGSNGLPEAESLISILERLMYGISLASTRTFNSFDKINLLPGAELLISILEPSTRLMYEISLAGTRTFNSFDEINFLASSSVANINFRTFDSFATLQLAVNRHLDSILRSNHNLKTTLVIPAVNVLRSKAGSAIV